MEKKSFNSLQLGIRFEKARREQQLTREQVASLCNITTVHLRHIEDGSRLPSLPVFILLCNTLHVSPTYFLADYIDLKAGLPDSYSKIVDILLQAPPRQAEIIVSMIETMGSLMDS